MNEIVVKEYSNLIGIKDLEINPELLICLEYLLLKETASALSMEEIAESLSKKYPSMPTTRQGLYYHIEIWRRDGTLRKAEELFLSPKLEEMRTALGEVITKMPNLIRRLTSDALDETKSAATALDIVRFLREIVRDEMEKQFQSGSGEKHFASKSAVFDPTIISEE